MYDSQKYKIIWCLGSVVANVPKTKFAKRNIWI